MIYVKGYGIENARDMMQFIAKLGASTTGIALHADSRDKGKASNADILRYQAEGIERKDGGVIVRDVTPTEKDSDQCAQIYLTRVEKVLRTLVNKTKGLTATGKISRRGPIKKPINLIAENAQASGLKTAGRKMQEILAARVREQLDQKGRGLTAVDEKYAKRRKAKFGVSESSVLKASGQLLRNLEEGQLRLSKIRGLAEMAKGYLGG